MLYKDLINQSKSLKTRARHHETHDNPWLSKTMDYSSKHFAEEALAEEKRINRILDSMPLGNYDDICTEPVTNDRSLFRLSWNDLYNEWADNFSIS